MNRIYHNGMTTLSGGNLSIKDDNGDIWLTPSGVDKGKLTPKDIVCVRADGTIMHALAGIYVLRATEGVAEFKLVQHTLRDLEVLVVPGPGWAPERAQAIESGLQQRLGADVRVAVRAVDAIAPEASGKHRYVVSHVALQGELAQASANH